MKTRTRAQPRAVPRRTEIGGQPHSLAYINPDEAELLRARGGGVAPDGGQKMHNGLPSFDEDGKGDSGGTGANGESDTGGGGGKGGGGAESDTGGGGAKGGEGTGAAMGGVGPDAAQAMDNSGLAGALGAAAGSLGLSGESGPGAETDNPAGGDFQNPQYRPNGPQGLLTPAPVEPPWAPMQPAANPWTPRAYTWGMSPAADYEQIRSRWSKQPARGLLG